MSTKAGWCLPGAVRDGKSVTADWMPVGQTMLHGVQVFEPRWVVKSNGRLVEMFRRDWLGDAHVDQVFQVVLNGHGISAWHAHERTIDRLFVSTGHVRAVLYDPRAESPTRGGVAEFLLDAHRPRLVVVPPGIWHGVQNLDVAPAVIVNMPDRAYDYDQPDHWRLPPTSAEIPYSFQTPLRGTAI
jgi:dTDP-4-dehydrorhamnose 3,5-epimerase